MQWLEIFGATFVSLNLWKHSFNRSFKYLMVIIATKIEPFLYTGQFNA